MQFSDTNATTRDGLIQDCEDICGLGANGISGNSKLMAQFTRWINRWNQKATMVIIKATTGFDYDDPNYTKYPSGLFTGTTSRDYVFGTDQDGVTQKLLKIKTVGISYDGVNFVPATAIDSTDLKNVKADPNIDSLVDRGAPHYDPKVGGFDIYPKFTVAEVTAGAKVYIEFAREATNFEIDDTTKTPGFATAFHEFCSVGASYEYALLYKPEILQELKNRIWGYRGRYGATISGLIDDMEKFYQDRYPTKQRLVGGQQNNK